MKYVEVSPNYKRLKTLLSEETRDILDRKLSLKMSRLVRVIVGVSKYNYLSGPRPHRLGQVTGRLFASINSRVRVTRRSRNSTIMGSVFSGTPTKTTLPYAAIHEYGFIGEQSVSAHQRRHTHYFGVPIVPPIVVSVREYTRFMHMPKRAYLSTAVYEVLFGRRKMAEMLQQTFEEVINAS